MSHKVLAGAHPFGRSGPHIPCKIKSHRKRAFPKPKQPRQIKLLKRN